MILGSTRAVADKLLRDIRRIAFGVSLGVQILFLAYYGWSIYSNIESLPFLIIYASLAVVAIVSFINFLVISKHKEKKNKKFNRFLRVLKYIINGAMLAVNAYQLFKYARTDLQIILLGLSGIFWLANIVIEIIRVSVEYYFNLFKVAIKTDFAFVEKISKKVDELAEKVEKFKEVKGNFWEAIDAPLETIANKLENKQKTDTPVQEEVSVTKAEKIVGRIKEKFVSAQEERKKAKKEQKRTEQEQEKEAVKQRSKERAEKEKKEIKEHLQVIKDKLFKKKNK